MPGLDDKPSLQNVGTVTVRIFEQAAQVNFVEPAIHHALQKMGTQFELPCPPRWPLTACQDSSTFPFVSSASRPGSPAPESDARAARRRRGQPDGMKVALSIPDEIFESGETLSKRLGVSRSRLYATALAEFVAKNRGRKLTERLNAVYGSEDSRLPQALRRLQSRSLTREPW